jgi:LmeA-like phospholipid-binding
MRKLLIALLVLVALLLAVDRVAKIVVEREAASRAQEVYNLSERPHITVHGFPFLTQVLSRKLGRVDVDAPGVTVEEADDLEVRFTARDVRLLAGYRGRAAQLDGSVTVPYQGLVQLARQTGASTFDLAYGGAPDTIAVRATIDGPAGAVDVVAFGDLRLTGSRLTMRPTRVEVDGAAADPLITEIARRELGLDVQIPQIPGAVRLRSLAAGEDGLRIGVTGQNVSVG